MKYCKKNIQKELYRNANIQQVNMDRSRFDFKKHMHKIIPVALVTVVMVSNLSEGFLSFASTQTSETAIVNTAEQQAESQIAVDVLQNTTAEVEQTETPVIKTAVELMNEFEMAADTMTKDSLVDPEVPVSLDSFYTGNDVDAFFADAIFVGDSVTVGLSNYYTSNKGSVFSDSTQFLAQVGASTKMSISSNAVSRYEKYMPSYNGSKCAVEDGVAASGAKKVFVGYGLNDLIGCTPSTFLSNLQTLIGKIQEKSPDTQIYVMSTTYVVSGAEKASLTNANIHASNAMVRAYCREAGWGFIDVADYLTDGSGALSASLSSDGYIHQKSSAYKIWVKVLRNYAYRQLTMQNQIQGLREQTIYNITTTTGTPVSEFAPDAVPAEMVTVPVEGTENVIPTDVIIVPVEGTEGVVPVTQSTDALSAVSAQ